MLERPLTKNDSKLMEMFQHEDIAWYSDKEYERIFNIIDRVIFEIENETFDNEHIKSLLFSSIGFLTIYEQREKHKIKEDTIKKFNLLSENPLFQKIMAENLAKQHQTIYEVLFCFENKSKETRVAFLNILFKIGFGKGLHYIEHFLKDKEEIQYFYNQIEDKALFEQKYTNHIETMLNGKKFFSVFNDSNESFLEISKNFKENTIYLNIDSLFDLLEKLTIIQNEELSKTLIKLINIKDLNTKIENDNLKIKGDPQFSLKKIRVLNKFLHEILGRNDVNFEVVGKSITFLDLSCKTQDFFLMSSKHDKVTLNNMLDFASDNLDCFSNEDEFLSLTEEGKEIFELNFLY